MFIPLYDSNRLRYIKHQYATYGLILINIIVFFFTSLGVTEMVANADVLGMGYIPAVAHNIAYLGTEDYMIPQKWTYITYAFLHADIYHVGGNMLFLWVFGDNVEDALGHFRFLIFYLACAVAGAFLHGIIMPDSEAPLIGASGAIAGVIAAYLILTPRVKLWVLAFMWFPMRIPAYIPLVLWVGFQFLMLVTQTQDEVSWPCHVGGIVAGAILVVLMRRKGVPLFDSNHSEDIVDASPTIIVAAPITAEPVGPSKWGRPE